MPRRRKVTKGRSRSHPQLRAQVRIFVGEEIAIGPGKADLLEAIRATGSISAAGRQMGMSYRRTWLLVDTMNRCFHTPLVETLKGGRHGGGARLTTHGEQILQRYRRMQSDVEMVTARHFQALRPRLRRRALPTPQDS